MVKRAFLVTVILLSAVSVRAGIYELNIYKALKGKKEKVSDYLVYKIKRGDTLLKIMKRFHIPRYKLKEIVKINKLKNPNLIYAGSKLRLPVASSEVSVKKGGRESALPYIEGMKLLGAKLERDGAIFLDNQEVNFKKYPKITLNGNQYVVDFKNSLDEQIKRKLKFFGITVVNATTLKKLFERSISSDFPSFQRNGNLTLGINDVLVYHYDYMGYDPSTGIRTVINLKPDTPKALKRLLLSYGVRVFQPKRKEKTDLTPKEACGDFKILTGTGEEKLAELVYLVSGHRAKVTKKGIVVPGCKIYAVLNSVTPQERVQLELKGYKVFAVSGDFSEDAQKLLQLIPIATKKVKLILEEPPSTGKRSVFSIVGIQILAPKKTWFMVDSFDKPEEIPYLRYRGINLIVY